MRRESGRGSAATATSVHRAPRPNIVVVMADDLGVCDLGVAGNPDARTPHLDGLAAESLRHHAFYVSPVCAPTRAAFLTGRHHLRSGVYGVHGGQDYLDLGERTLPEILRAAGYATGMWGKWHNGSGEGYEPWQRGFDEALRLRLYRHRDPEGQCDGAAVAFPERWADEVLVDHALDFLARHREQPVFAFVASMTPHGPLDAPADLVASFRARGLSDGLATLHAMNHLLDQAIGRLRAGIDALDLARETVVVFLSDNGPAMNEGTFTDAERARRNVLGWRGWKGDVWEAGVRTPLFVHWPQRLGVGDVHQPASVEDLLPTFAGWAGVDAAAQADPQRPLDGRDIDALLRGERLPEQPVYSWVHPAFPPYEGDRARREALDEYRPLTSEDRANMCAADQVMAVRHGEWKLTRNADRLRNGDAGDQVLHRVASDPGETHDLSDRHPEQVADLGAQLERWWAEIRAEPRAFMPPVHRLGPEPRRLPVVACRWLSPGLRNGVAAITGIRAAGSEIRWALDVSVSRSVRPGLSWWRGQQPAAGTRLRLACSGAHVDGTVAADGSVAWDDDLPVDAGPATLALCWLDGGQVAADLLAVDLA